MPEKPTFVVNDRRKFTAEGELRPESISAEPTPAAMGAETNGSDAAHIVSDHRKGPQLVGVDADGAPVAAQAELADLPESSVFDAPGLDSASEPEAFPDEDALPPGPTAEQVSEAARAYEATVDRLDTAMRAANPGGERMPEMTFERLVQSLYTQALMLLGGGTEPGETPRIDILGARQTIDMLAVIAARTRGNLSAAEDQLLESALFDLRMGFLEITQALARQAAQRQAPAGGAPLPGAGPRIVR